MTRTTAVAGRVGPLTDSAACAGSVLVQKTLFCTDLARTEAVLVNALLAEGTECARHHCALFLARTWNSPWGGSSGSPGSLERGSSCSEFCPNTTLQRL